MAGLTRFPSLGRLRVTVALGPLRAIARFEKGMRNLFLVSARKGFLWLLMP
jgi:hypothetical protein